jgi:autotransporter-associated beta strand protein
MFIGDGAGTAGSAVVNALKAFAIASSSAVTIASDGLLNLNNTNQSIAGLVGTGKVVGGSGALSNTLTVTVPAGANYLFTGVISGSGLTFAKLGDGVQILGGINTYTGPTNIGAGELQVDGRIGPGLVTVANGATLGGSGTITGNTKVQPGGIVDPGAAGGGIGTLNVASLLFENGSIYHVDVGLTAAGAITNDRLNGGSITIQAGGTASLQFNSFAGYNGMSINIAHSTVAYGGLFATGAAHGRGRHVQDRASQLSDHLRGASGARRGAHAAPDGRRLDGGRQQQQVVEPEELGQQ